MAILREAETPSDNNALLVKNYNLLMNHASTLKSTRT